MTERVELTEAEFSDLNFFIDGGVNELREFVEGLLAARLSALRDSLPTLTCACGRTFSLPDVERLRAELAAATVQMMQRDERIDALQSRLDAVTALAESTPHKTTDHLGNVTGYLIGADDLRRALAAVQAEGSRDA